MLGLRLSRNIPVLLLALTFAVAGCAKKAPAPPPAPPPAPEVKEVPPPPPPAQQPEQTPPAPSVTGDDFQPAFFDFDSYTLRDDARAALDKNAKVLRDNAGINVTIEGHCDERGTSE